MEQTKIDSPDATLQRSSGASSDQQEFLGGRELSDREAVIAVMTANGAACEAIASRLSLPLEEVERHLRQALEILELEHAEDLTYVIVAAHYNRNAPRTYQPRTNE